MLSAGCAGVHTGDGGVDAGRDAGRDAGWDAGRDAGRDAAFPDAGRDAGTDAGPRDGGPDDPGWVRLPGLPPECPIERATYPERLWDVVWEPCTDRAGTVVPGCLSERRAGVMGIVNAWHDEHGTWLKMLGGDSLGTGRIVGIAAIDGPMLAAWHEPPIVIDEDVYREVTAVAVGGARAVFVAQFIDSADRSRSRIWMYVGTPETIGAAEEPVWVFPSGFVSRGRTIHDLWISDRMIALQPSPDGTLYTYRAGESYTLTGRGTVTGLPQNIALVGDHILWEAWRGLDDVRLVHARWGEASRIWRDVSPGDTKGFGTDGVDLAWQQAFDRQPDGSYARIELWTAPYRRDIESIEPRLVRTMDYRSPRAAFGGGWFAVRGPGPGRVEVFSLSDGSRRTFMAPAGSVSMDPYYASATEIMFRGAGSDAIRFDPSILPVDPEP